MVVRVVTDSTAYLPSGTRDVGVVPLTVTIFGEDGREGIDVSPADVARALGERRANVTTSRPAPADFETEYERLFAQGADAVVSVHLSAKLSSTYESALLAAAAYDGRVIVVDSRSAGTALGFVAMAASDAARRGLDAEAVREAALSAASRTSTLFYVDTLEFLRKGGRINAAQALLGTALSVKPILHVADGEVVLREKVRTTTRALARMVDLVADDAGESDVDIAVQHLAAPDRAESLHAAVTQRLGERVRSSQIAEIGAVLAAHTGPGVIGVALLRRA